jgi:hypothetical protein
MKVIIVADVMVTLHGDVARPENPRMRFLNSADVTGAGGAVVTKLTNVRIFGKTCTPHPFQLLASVPLF